MDNAEIARHLSDAADLLEIQGENPFRIRAYRNAVHTVEAETIPLRRRVAEGFDLTQLPGIGKDMASHIREMVGTGRLLVLEQLAREIPLSLLDLMRIQGVGPKKAKRLWQELGVTDVDGLEAAARAGRVAELEGFGEKSQAKILAGIAEARQHSERMRIDQADRVVQPLLEHLARLEEVERLEVAGSWRRRKETIGDLDLLAIASDPGPVMAAFTGYDGVERIEGAGSTRGSVVLGSGLHVDLRVVPRESYGAAMVYFTGSKEHNVKLRGRAVDRGLRINEYGVFRIPPGEDTEDPRDGERVAGEEEADVYASVGLPWIPPELREDRGEIAAAEARELPELITLEDLRGDLQMHSTWSDGKASIDAMVSTCAARGYEYLALTDHSKSLAMTRGLDAKRLREQWREIEEVQAAHPEIRILKSQEIDILADGRLDLEDEMIDQLDWVLVSIHSRFELPAAEQTERILKAIAHPRVHIFAHPTGRLINQRKPYDFDLDAVLDACLEHDVAVELNAHPVRLDLKDTQLMLARKKGVRVVISTDAHSTTDLALMPYGIEQARRAWLEPKHVLNTLPLAQLLGVLARKRV
ncbi:MAG TPA: DNA polymerase/3'-5' exonuclease PolX [Thermoanaerobaculia bacterium]|nr:DNA polymerase/3'-5' exonuclease PolX [Thermoanaerobaculia bacterium]